MTRVFGQFKFDRVTSLLLPDFGSIDGMTPRGNVLDSDAYNITASQLAIDR